MDEQGRILVPGMLREQIGWGTGASLSAIVDEESKTLILARGEGLVINEIGCITVKKDVREQLGFGVGDKIALTLDLEGKKIKLTLSEKYVPKCVLCDKQEETVTINGRGVCESCVALIAQVEF